MEQCITAYADLGLAPPPLDPAVLAVLVGVLRVPTAVTVLLLRLDLAGEFLVGVEESMGAGVGLNGTAGVLRVDRVEAGTGARRCLLEVRVVTDVVSVVFVWGLAEEEEVDLAATAVVLEVRRVNVRPVR